MRSKMHKLLSLILALIVVLSLGHALTAEAEAAEITPVAAPMYGRNALAALDNSTALLYAYDQIAAGIANCEEKILVYNGTDTLTVDEIKTVMDAYGRDYSYHFWLGNAYSITSYTYTVTGIIPQYIMTGDALETAKAKFNAEAEKMLSGITPGMSDYDKELYLHDALAKKIVYAESDNAHNAYGALVEGVSVCEGYAEALQYLLQRCGIQSFIIEGGGYNPSTGKYEAHAWNAVNIGGQFAHVDLTWNDQGDEIYHAYFNVTDSMILRDHAIASTSYALPVCSSDSNFYFKNTGTSLDTYTVDQVGKLLKDNEGSVHVWVPGDQQTFLNWYVENIVAIAQAAGVKGTFQYAYAMMGHEMVLIIPQLQPHEHSYTPAVTAPTCTAEGYTTYTCTCGDEYVSDTVSALGHDKKSLSGYAPTCTEPGLTDGESCIRCGQTLKAQEIIPAPGHETVVDEAVAPTCTADGKTEGSHCATCHAVLKAQETDPAKGHTPVVLPGVAPTCTAAGLKEGKECSQCGEILTAQETIPATGHTEVRDEAVAPTCQKTGLTEGKHCSVCNAVLVAQTVVDKLSHTEAAIPAVAPSCTATGLTAGKKCSVCDEILIAQETVPVLDHVAEVVPGTAPTCSAAGKTEGKKCSLCGATLLVQETIPALDHTPKTVPGSAPTCTEVGYTDGETCSICGTVTKAQAEIPATGHSWTGSTCSSCGAVCEHDFDENGNCPNCGAGCTHEYETAVVAPTCTAQGYTVYTCSLCGNTYKDAYKDALGHSWKAATCKDPKTCAACGLTEGEPNGHDYKAVVTPPTCTDQGYTTHTCHCGETYTDSYTEAQGHTPGTPVEENRKEPGCTSDGSYDAIVYCTVCNAELSNEKIILPAKGHDYAQKVTAPTCTDQGYTTHVCKNCDAETVDSYTPAAGHSYGKWSVSKEPGCTEEGEKRRTCKNCDAYETETVEPAGHDWNGDLCERCGESRNLYKVELTLADSESIQSAWVDGKEYPVTQISGGIRVELADDSATNLVIYSYNDPNAADKHTQYPTGMRVWLLTYEEGYTATYVPEFTNLLQYSGSSIRVTGKKGIRMITSIDKATRTALMGKGLAGYTLVEYGTAVAWASNLSESKPLVLGAAYTLSNYAYREGVADPIFQDTGDQIQYTNVLVGFGDDQCKPDLVMRPYIILENGAGEQITLYGGQITRSIGYIAYQNRDVFDEGTAAYDYVWDIIHKVYGE